MSILLVILCGWLMGFVTYIIVRTLDCKDCSKFKGPPNLVESRRVVSQPGAAIQVEQLTLTPEAQRALTLTPEAVRRFSACRWHSCHDIYCFNDNDAHGCHDDRCPHAVL